MHSHVEIESISISISILIDDTDTDTGLLLLVLVSGLQKESLQESLQNQTTRTCVAKRAALHWMLCITALQHTSQDEFCAANRYQERGAAHAHPPLLEIGKRKGKRNRSGNAFFTSSAASQASRRRP